MDSGEAGSVAEGWAEVGSVEEEDSAGGGLAAEGWGEADSAEAG